MKLISTFLKWIHEIEEIREKNYYNYYSKKKKKKQVIAEEELKYTGWITNWKIPNWVARPNNLNY